MHDPDPREVVSRADDDRAEARSPDDDPEERGRRLEAHRRYLLLVANKEIAPGLRAKGGASDLVQETMLEAHRDLDQFSGQSPSELKGWLRRILRNNVANFVRRYRVSGKRRVECEVALEGDVLASTTPSPGEAAIRSELNARIERARSRLTERERNVLEWHIDDQCDWKTIGQRIGGSADMARKICSRAMKRLQNEVCDVQESSPA